MIDGFNQAAANPGLPSDSVQVANASGATNVPAAPSPQGSNILSYDQIRQLVANNNLSGLSNDLITAIIYKESTFDANAENPAPHSTATGLMQLTDPLLDDLDNNYDGFENVDPYDPVQNIRAGTQYLALILDRFGGNVTTALSHYGTGPQYAASILAAEQALQQNPTNPVATLNRVFGRR